MSDTILLRHVPLNSHKFKNKHCEDVFAFREFSPEDSDELKQAVGVECKRETYIKHMNGERNYQAFVYTVKPAGVVHYVFSTKEDMQCVEDNTPTYHDVRWNYYSNDYKTTTSLLLEPEDELTAIQQQFSHETARHLCREKGMLYHNWHTEKIALRFYKPSEHFFESLDCNDVYAFRRLHSDDADIDNSKLYLYCSKSRYLGLLHGNLHFRALTYYINNDLGSNVFGKYTTTEYVFSSWSDMHCDEPNSEVIEGYSSRNEYYTNNGRNLYPNGVEQDFLMTESKAITSQFGLVQARMVCRNLGKLKFMYRHMPEQLPTTTVSTLQTSMLRCCDCPASTNTTLLIDTTTTVFNNVFNNTRVDTIPYSSVVNTTLLMNTTSTVPVSEMEVLSSAATVLLASPVLLAPVILAIHNVCDMFFDGLANWLTNFSIRK